VARQDELTVRKSLQRRGVGIVMRGAGGGDLASHTLPVGVIDLKRDFLVVVRADQARAVLPGDHEAACRQAQDLRIELRCGCGRVDLKFTAHRCARGVVAWANTPRSLSPVAS